VSGWLIALGLVVGVLVCAPLARIAWRRIRIARQRALIKGVFSRYVSPDVVDELIREPLKAPEPAERRTISFVVFQVRDDDIENAQKQIERALPIVTEGDGLVEHVASSLVIAIFSGFQRNESVAEDNRARVAARLMSELGPEIRLVHGSAVGLIGLLSTGSNLRYGSLLPNFGRILDRLLKLEFGQSAEISPALT
jgi:hypothetical protein